LSLIETALNKMQQSATAKGIGAPRSEGNLATSTRKPRSPVRADAVTPTVRQFQRTEIDSTVMELNCILPGIADQSALRAYKILRTRMLQRLAANQWHSVAITGTEAGQGKTLTAINLAIALAQDPSTHVFLVDLDLQRPQIASYMGLKFGRGLGEYLTGDATIDQIIYDPGIPRLAIIPNSRSFEHSSEHLAGSQMLNLLAELDAQVPRRVVIFDMPPVLMSDDVMTFAPHIDGVALVVAEGVTTRGSLERSKEVLAEMNLIGVILNRSAERSDSPYY